MLQIFIYAIAVAAALSLVGLADSRLATMRHVPRRCFWALAMALSIAWPVGMLMWNRPAPVLALPEAVAVVPPQAAVPALPEAQWTAPAPAGTAQLESAGTWQTLPSSGPLVPDRALLGAWALLTGGLLLYLVFAALALARRASRWTHADVQGRQVLVSESTGPALLGVFRPKIVVPRWFLDEPVAKQSLILEHEEQHVVARDPLLFRFAVLIAVALPWNLPLWWQLRRLRQAIELDCDARVMRGGAEPAAYGEVLLDVTRRCGDVPFGAVAMGEPVSALELRVRSLVPDPKPHSVARAVFALLLGVGGVAVAASLEAPQMPARVSADQAAQQDVDMRVAELKALQQQKIAAALEQRAREQESAKTREKVLREKLYTLAAAQASAAPQPAPVAPAAAKDARPTMELLDLITMAGGRFKKQFIVDPRVGGPVNVDTLAVNSLTYHAFLEVLGVHGFVAVPSGDVVTIIPEELATKVASPIVNVDDIKGDDAEIVTALIPVGENSMQLNPILRQIVPKWGFVQAMPDQKSLLVVDRVANIKRIAALVRAQGKAQ